MRILSRAFDRKAICAACVGAILMLCANCISSAEKGMPPSAIDDLLQKRLAVLEEYERAIKERIRIDPQMSPFAVHPATVAVMNARLDLAKSPEGQLKVLQEMVGSAKEWERFVVEGLIKSGNAGKWEALKAKAEVLEAQIALERFKENVKQSTSRP
jgi:hypothetical protein